MHVSAFLMRQFLRDCSFYQYKSTNTTVLTFKGIEKYVTLSIGHILQLLCKLMNDLQKLHF